MVSSLLGASGIRVFARSSALSNTLASMTHSKKLDPSELIGANIKACILDSVKLGFVDIDTLLCVLSICENEGVLCQSSGTGVYIWLCSCNQIYISG